VLFILLTPLPIGFLVGLVAFPWLHTLKPSLFKIVLWMLFVIGALIGVAFIVFTGGGNQ